MKSIFLNAPKEPKDVRFYGKILLALSLSCLIGLSYALYLKEEQKGKAGSVAFSALPTAEPSASTPPSARVLSVRDPKMARQLDQFFGPLPLPPAEKVPLKELYPVRGIYLGQAKEEDLAAALALARSTEVNAFVIDVKESWGLCYQSQVPLAVEMKASSGTLDLKSIFARCHEAGVSVIARIVCFKDEVMTAQRPDLCIRDINGQLLHFPLEGGLAFASPYETRVWQYLIDIGREVHALGADEIQFDYVRFPTGRPESDTEAYFGEGEIPAREYAINRFLETARVELQEKDGIPITADLFSIVMSSPVDGRAIGQNWGTIGLTGLDAICPMIYPSHYANASYGNQGNGVGSYIGQAFFEAPDLDPYEVIINALLDGAQAFHQRGYARLRPWLQAFTADFLAPGFYMEYGPGEIRTQIKACSDAGIVEWLLWNASFTYPESAFLSKEAAEKDMAAARSSREESLAHTVTLSPEEEAEEASRRRFPIATAAETLGKP